jgi:hypothetical protein
VVRVSGYRFRGPGFDSRRFQIFWEAEGLERGRLSLMRTTEELLERKVAAPVKKTEVNDLGNLLPWPRDTLYPRKLAVTSPTSGGRSVGIVRSRTKAAEFSLVFLFLYNRYFTPSCRLLTWANTIISSTLTITQSNVAFPSFYFTVLLPTFVFWENRTQPE